MEYLSLKERMKKFILTEDDKKHIMGLYEQHFKSGGITGTKPVNKKVTPPQRWPNWVTLVTKLKEIPYPYVTHTPSDIPDSVIWNGKQGWNLDIQEPKPNVNRRDEEINLFNLKDRKNQEILHQWWKKQGYSTDGNTVSIQYKDADKLKNDLMSFFKVFPPIMRKRGESSYVE